uniref:Type I site-specific deoxyribonuclease n=1 Tax=Globodera pallida TaxID=36090 RepID=A0A183CQM0_GLOPA
MAWILAEYEDFGWIAFEEISFDKVSSVFKKFCTDAPDELDNLFDEVVELKEVVRELEATEGFSKKNLEKKWGEVLKDKNLKHIKTL